MGLICTPTQPRNQHLSFAITDLLINVRILRSEVDFEFALPAWRPFPHSNPISTCKDLVHRRPLSTNQSVLALQFDTLLGLSTAAYVHISAAPSKCIHRPRGCEQALIVNLSLLEPPLFSGEALIFKLILYTL